MPHYAPDLKGLLENGVILRDGEGWIKLTDEDPVHIAIVADVQGYGPHEAAIFVDQNRYHASPDLALQGAYDILEQYMMNHNADHVKELMDEWGDEWDSILTETFDGWTWKMSADDAVAVILGTDAEGFVQIDFDEGNY